MRLGGANVQSKQGLLDSGARDEHVPVGFAETLHSSDSCLVDVQGRVSNERRSQAQEEAVEAR